MSIQVTEGEPAVTLRAVADHAGVSISTASRALSGAGRVSAATESRVVAAMQALNYRPWNRAIGRPGRQRQQPPFCLGAVLGSARYKYSDPYWSPVLDGLDSELRRHGHELGFAVSVDDLDEVGRPSGNRREPDGLVLLGDFAQRPDLIDVRRTVVVGGEDELRWQAVLPADFVTAEKRRAIYAVVAHLARLGRRRIGFLGPGADKDERAEAFPHALQRVGLTSDPTLVIVESSWTIDGAYEAARRFFRDGGLSDALVCASDELALGVMRAARESGLDLPEDLAITGFDDVPFAGSLHPPLTTVRLPREVVGAVAARKIIDRLTDPEQPATTAVVPTRLVVRSSCGEEPQPNDGHGPTRPEY